MPDQGESLLNVAIEIRELLRLLAEPAIAPRDERLRAILRQLVGRSALKQKAVFLMDGNRTQSEIRQEVAIDQGDLSKLVKALRAENLLSNNEKPSLQIPLPKTFFESGTSQ